MYQNSKNIAQNDKYISSMIWGCQWDRILEWIAQTNGNNYSLITDSSNWGNYYSQEFEYIKEDGSVGKKSKNSETVIPTGSTERNKKNNIYDMAGNIFDWTIEAYDTNDRTGRRRLL